MTMFATPQTQNMAVDPAVIGVMQQNLSLMGKILEGNAPASALKMYQKAVGSSGNASLFHGTGSIGADAKMDRNVINNVVQSSGLLDHLPAIPTIEDLTEVGLITGYDPDATPEPDHVCENAPSGTYTTCRVDFRLGRVIRDSKDIFISDAITRAHRGDMDLMFRGQMVGMLGNMSATQLRNLSPSQILNIVSVSEMQGIGTSFSRVLGRMLWNGDRTAPAPANTPNGGKRSFNGLDLLITTGYEDVESAIACPSMDSIVQDFAFNDIGTTGIAGFDNIARLISALTHYITTLADGLGLTPVDWVLSMHPNLWYELTAVYPCMFLSDRCGGNVTVTGNDDFVVNMREAMRTGMYLPINGVNVPVVVDHGIAQLNTATNPTELPNPNDFASTIYFVPRSIMGNFPTLFLPYKDFRFANAEIATLFGGNKALDMQWTDMGKYIFATEQNNFCFKIKGMLEPGLVLRTPQLAFKITDIKYSAVQALRSPYPGDTTYL